MYCVRAYLLGGGLGLCTVLKNLPSGRRLLEELLHHLGVGGRVVRQRRHLVIQVTDVVPHAPAISNRNDTFLSPTDQILICFGYVCDYIHILIELGCWRVLESISGPCHGTSRGPAGD